MRYFLITVSILFVTVIANMGKRSDTFSRPPWQVFPDMDDQDKYLPQRSSTFFEDGRADRPIPANTVHRGNQIDVKEAFAPKYADQRFSDDPKTIALMTGLDSNGELFKGFPIEVNEANLTSGQVLYNRNCAVCHGVAGDGNGVTKAFGMGNSANFHDPARQYTSPGKPEGGIFKVLTEGFAAGATGMVSFADRLTPRERWKVTLYIRALQKMRVAPADVAKLPAHVVKEINNLKITSTAQPVLNQQ
jgi:mono/diheme cytochrome c family protein